MLLHLLLRIEITDGDHFRLKIWRHCRTSRRNVSGLFSFHHKLSSFDACQNLLYVICVKDVLKFANCVADCKERDWHFILLELSHAFIETQFRFLCELLSVGAKSVFEVNLHSLRQDVLLITCY